MQKQNATMNDVLDMIKNDESFRREIRIMTGMRAPSEKTKSIMKDIEDVKLEIEEINEKIKALNSKDSNIRKANLKKRATLLGMRLIDLEKELKVAVEDTGDETSSKRKSAQRVAQAPVVRNASQWHNISVGPNFPEINKTVLVAGQFKSSNVIYFYTGQLSENDIVDGHYKAKWVINMPVDMNEKEFRVLYWQDIEAPFI